MIEKIYEAAFNLWNRLCTVAMTLFTTSPTEANGSVYTIAYGLYNAITDIAVPIAITFFLIAIIQDVLATSPEQQVRRLFNDLLKFGVLVAILANLWTIMGYIMQIADGVTDKFATSGTYSLSVSSELKSIIRSVENSKPDVEIKFKTFGEDFAEYMEELMDYLLNLIVLFVAAVATFAGILSAGLSLINSSYQRIIKPLAIMPFSSITVALAAGTAEAKRTTTSYLKTFFGFCISGAFMVICVKLGTALSDGLLSFNMASMELIEKVLLISVQNAVTPIMIAGLVKATDSVIQRFF